MRKEGRRWVPESAADDIKLQTLRRAGRKQYHLRKNLQTPQTILTTQETTVL